MTREQNGIVITETARREAAPESSVNARRRMGTETEAILPKWEERWNACRKMVLPDLKKDGYEIIHHEKKHFKDTLYVALRRHHEVDVLRGFA